MLISIITPTYNSEKNIDKCAQSVINQTYKNFEHIIVDNLSTDKTLEKIKKIYSTHKLQSNLRIISEKDEGISDAFNKGISFARGSIIGILNSDDFYYSVDVFEKVGKEFLNSEIQIVHGDIYFVDPVYGSNIRKPLKAPMMKGFIYNHTTMFIKKSFYQKLELYDVNYNLSMDFEFYCKISKYSNPDKISVYLTEKPLVQMNFGGASWKNELQSIEEIKSALQKHKLWNLSGKRFYQSRKMRTLVKGFIIKFGMNYLIKFWRNLKWKNVSK